MRRWLERSADSHTTSDWALAEFASALGLKVRRRELVAAQADAVQAAPLAEFLPEIQVVETDADLMRAAPLLLQEYGPGLRAGRQRHALGTDPRQRDSQFVGTSAGGNHTRAEDRQQVAVPAARRAARVAAIAGVGRIHRGGGVAAHGGDHGGPFQPAGVGRAALAAPGGILAGARHPRLQGAARDERGASPRRLDLRAGEGHGLGRRLWAREVRTIARGARLAAVPFRAGCCTVAGGNRRQDSAGDLAFGTLPARMGIEPPRDDAVTEAPVDALFGLLGPERLTAVVDVGSNPIDGDPPYKTMFEQGLCTVLGFEPQASAFALLSGRASPRETHLPWAVGDGGRHTLHICEAPGMTSLLRPDPRMLALFHLFPAFGNVVATEEIQTRRLDDIEEVGAFDFLKMDVQGSELAVLEGAREKLAAAVAVQTEISFLPLYEDQPVFHQIDRELRQQGFVPHAFASIKRWAIAPLMVNGDPRLPLNQLLEADIVYVRDFARPEALSDAQLGHLALIAHHCYRSHDLAMRCVVLLSERGRLAAGAQGRYQDIVNAGG
jgi:FkbM family methyltransferase